MNKWIELAKPIRAVMDKAGAMLDDAQASTVITLYGGMKYNGALITAGTRINWRGQLKRAASDLWDTDLHNPDNAPELWEDVAYRDGCRVIPETITATMAFSLDETGWWNGALYRSLRDGNTFNPGATPEWWERLE